MKRPVKTGTPRNRVNPSKRKQPRGRPKGHKLSPATKRKIRNTLAESRFIDKIHDEAYKHSDETKAKMSAAHKEYHLTGKTKKERENENLN